VKYISFDKSVLIPSAFDFLAIHAVIYAISLSIIFPEISLIIFAIRQEKNTPSALKISVELS